MRDYQLKISLNNMGSPTLSLCDVDQFYQQPNVSEMWDNKGMRYLLLSVLVVCIVGILMAPAVSSQQVTIS